MKHGYARDNAPQDLTYTSWENMRSRCSNARAPYFKDYGGRGISVCDRWSDFSAFLADMGPRPSRLHSIERKDNDGNYEPANCRWATRKEQQRNRRANRFVEVAGERVCLTEASERLGISTGTLLKRVRAGAQIDMPVINEGSASRAARYEWQGRMLRLSEISKLTGISTAVLRKRFKKTGTFESPKVQEVFVSGQWVLPAVASELLGRHVGSVFRYMKSGALPTRHVAATQGP